MRRKIPDLCILCKSAVTHWRVLCACKLGRQTRPGRSTHLTNRLQQRPMSSGSLFCANSLLTISRRCPIGSRSSAIDSLLSITACNTSEQVDKGRNIWRTSAISIKLLRTESGILKGVPSTNSSVLLATSLKPCHASLAPSFIVVRRGGPWREKGSVKGWIGSLNTNLVVERWSHSDLKTG